MLYINNDWDEILKDEFLKDYYINLSAFLNKEYTTQTIFPPLHDVFNALKFTPYANVKVVILGQDPYHGKNQAHGLAFSVLPNTPVPPSLKNIYKELSSDLSLPLPTHGNLTPWANQGVLLLNTTLTVKAGVANSHKNKGWETFTDAIIKSINQKEQPVVFMLWGNNAKAKIPLITNPIHLILTAPHPSPLSAYHGFFGCKHFSKANAFLASKISWQID